MMEELPMLGGSYNRMSMAQRPVGAAAHGTQAGDLEERQKQADAIAQPRQNISEKRAKGLGEFEEAQKLVKGVIEKLSSAESEEAYESVVDWAVENNVSQADKFYGQFKKKDGILKKLMTQSQLIDALGSAIKATDDSHFEGEQPGSLTDIPQPEQQQPQGSAAPQQQMGGDSPLAKYAG